MNKGLKIGIIISVILFIAVVVIGVIIYKNIQDRHIEGIYTTQTLFNEISYTFDYDTVEMNIKTAGIKVYNKVGTYKINYKLNEITLDFGDIDSNITEHISSDILKTNGTFKYENSKDYIIIDGTKYSLADNSNENTNKTTDDVQANLNDIELKLPNEYDIEYSITEKSVGKRTYTSEMIQTDKGIYLNIGESNEKYVFEKTDNNKYLKYQYNALTGKFSESWLSSKAQEEADKNNLDIDVASIDKSVVDSFTIRVSSYFDYYKTFPSNATYLGLEDVNGVSCQKYTVNVETVSGNQNVTLWINPGTGLCMKGTYEFTSLVGTKSSKTILCTKYETKNISLPEYK